jgi:hypothetical protein
VPDWLLHVPRLIWAPIRWADRRWQRRGFDRRALVREGAEVVTPVKEVVLRSLGPVSIMWGSDEQNAEALTAASDALESLLSKLLTYANQHPSDHVRKLAHEAVDAVWGDWRATAALLQDRKTTATTDSYNASERAHDQARDATERLMKAIRAY